MKKIVLKPVLEISDKVNIDDLSGYKVISLDSIGYKLINESNNLTTFIKHSLIKDIIELPDELLPNDDVYFNKNYVEGFTAAVKHVRQYMSDLINDHGREALLQTLFAMVNTDLEAMIEKKPLSNESPINQVRESAKMVDDSAENSKKVDSNLSTKPAFKLRVGGVYKNRNDTIKKIIKFMPECFLQQFKDEEGLCYYEDGAYLFSKERCNSDLIEEVQPQQQEQLPCSNCDELTDLSLPLCRKCWEGKKSEGNPFKVGETVRAHFVNTDSLGTYLAVERKGKILKLADHGECIQINFENWQPGWVHHKQCERVG